MELFLEIMEVFMKLLQYSLFMSLFYVLAGNALTILPPFINNNQYVITIIDNENTPNQRTVGSLCYYPVTAEKYKIDWLWIDKSHRQSKLGSTLLSICFAHLQMLSCKKIVLYAMPLDNNITLDKLINFYCQIFLKLAPNAKITVEAENNCYELIADAKISISL